MKKLIVLIAFSLTAACAPAGESNLFEGEALNDNMQVENDQRFIDGEMTDSEDLNPNFLDLNGENETHNNHGFYQEKLREGVERSGVFDPGFIYSNGRRITVNVRPKAEYDENDIKRLESDLQLLVPKYEVRVRVNNKEK